MKELVAYAEEKDLPESAGLALRANRELGNTYMLFGKPELGLPYFLKVYEIVVTDSPVQKRNVRITADLALCYLALKSYPEAEEAIVRFLKAIEHEEHDGHDGEHDHGEHADDGHHARPTVASWWDSYLQATLGAALLGGGKQEEAEALLKQGYQGMQVYREQGRFYLTFFEWRQRMLTEQLVAIFTALEQPDKVAEYTEKLLTSKINIPVDSP